MTKMEGTGIAPSCRETVEMSPWDYYISLKYKRWDELSAYEQKRIVLAAYLILCDIGILATKSEVEEFLQSHLPEQSDPFCGRTTLRGFWEWQSSKIR